MPLLLGLKREGLLLSSPSVSLSVYPSFYLSLDFLSLFKFPLLFPNHFVSSFLLLSLYLSLLILSLSLSLSLSHSLSLSPLLGRVRTNR